MLKVLLMIDRPEIAGGQQNLLIIRSGLDGKKFAPVVSTSEGSGLNDVLREEGGDVFNVDMKARFNPFSIWKLGRRISAEKIGVIHAFGLITSCYAVLAAKCAGIGRVIYSQNGLHYRKEKALLVKIRFFLERFVARNAYVVICCCRFDYEESIRLRLIEASKGVVIYNGIKLGEYERLRDSGDREVLKGKFGTQGKKVICAVGRLAYQKNHEFLLAVMKVLSDRLPYAVLLLVGAGEKLSSLEELIRQYGLEGRVFLMGHRADYLDVMRSADIFVNCSRWEGVSIALMEALALGMPVVASDINGNRELVEDGGNGFLVSTTDVKGFAGAIERLLTDSRLMQSFSARSVEISRERVDSTKAIRAIEDLYLSCAAAKAGGSGS